MKKKLLVLLYLGMSTWLFSQSPSNSLFTYGDEFDIVLTGDSEYYYVHEIQKGQSLYGLSQTFNIPLSKIYQLNGLRKEATISIGQRIKIPIKDEYLFKGVDLSGLRYGHYIPVYYQTKPKDNLFRISRIYFNQPTEDLIKRNKLKSNNLALGQKILVGWFPIDGTPPVESHEEFEEEFDEEDELMTDQIVDNEEERESMRHDEAVTGDSMTADSLQQEIVYPEGFNLSLLGNMEYSDKMKQMARSEVAHWDKAMPDNGMVYVLHQEAVIDSYLEMYNPILKRSVRAKVIGRIPYGAYTNDVRLVLSPRTAKQLGALDRRFKVEVKALVYQKDE